jgi:hypothetical protein
MTNETMMATAMGIRMIVPPTIMASPLRAAHRSLSEFLR